MALEDEKANDDAHEPASLTKVGLAFAPNLRMAVYGLLNAHVSTTNMKMAIVHTARAFGIDIEDDKLPSRLSVERMQLEIGYISDMQVSTIAEIVK